jgi:integrase/recombinase XerC
MNDIQVYDNAQIQISQAITADLFTRFIAFLDVKAKTAETYTRALKQFSKYLAKNEISSPTRQDIFSFRSELEATDHKPTTIQNYIIAVRLFFKWTEQEQLYPNIAEHIKGAKLDREHKRGYLTADQCKQILAGIERDTLRGMRDYAIIVLMITGGLRTIEVSRANIEDLETAADSTVLYVQGKGKDERAEYVKVISQAERAIRAYFKARGKADPKEPLFASTSHNNQGGRLSTRSISGIVKERMRAAGFDSDKLTAHSLRHTAVTIPLLAEVKLTDAQAFARHADISTTMIYNHAVEKNKAKDNCGAVIKKALFGKTDI